MSQQKETKKKQTASKRPKRVSPGRQQAPKYAGKALILHRLYVALTIVAAVIVVLYLAWTIFSGAPTLRDPDLTRPPQTTTIIDDDGNEIEVEIPGLSADRKEQFYTFLLVGQDTYGGGNTDTMMLVAYDVPNQVLNVMSLPRDTYVNYNGRKVLLNSVYNRAGGAKDDKGITALKKEVGELTGVTPDYHVIVQWTAVGELVDAIEGVDFEVPRRMYYNDLSQNFKIDLQAGWQHLDGDKAMQLIRWRHNSDDRGNILNSGYADGDLGRINTQQDFMKAIIKKCLQMDVLLSNLGEYISIFQSNVVTNLTAGELAYFVKSAVGGLNMDNVAFETLPWKNAGDGAHLLPVGSEVVEAINAGYNPYKENIQLRELDLVTSIGTSQSGGTTTSTTSPSSTPATESQPPAQTGEGTPPSERPEEGTEVVLPPGTSSEVPVEVPGGGTLPEETSSAETPPPAEGSTPAPAETPVPEEPGEEEPLLPPGV